MASLPTGLLTGFEADSIVGLADQAAVANWPGLLAGHAAAQGTTTAQPKLQLQAEHGHNSVRFDGSSDLMAFNAAVLAVLQNVGAVTTYAVYRVPAVLPTGSRCIASFSTGTTTGSRLALFQNITVTNIRQVAGRRLDADAFGSVAGSSGSTAGALEVLTARMDWTNSDAYLLANGTQIGSSTSFQTSGSTSNTPSLTGYLGANAAGAELFSGDLIAFYIFSGADSGGTQRARVHSYIQTRFGALVSDYAGIDAEDSGPFVNSYVENFTAADIAEGGFVAGTQGSDGGLLQLANPYVDSFKVKSNGSTGDNAQYNASKTTSVVGGVFQIRSHYESGIAYSGAIKPLLPGSNPVDQKYGRYIIDMEVESDDAGWGLVVDHINPNTWSQGTGEIGHPENDFFDGPLGAFIHPANGLPNPHTYQYRVNYPQFNLNDRHTYEVRWSPNLLQLLVNDIVVHTTTTNVANTNLGYLLQTGAPGIPGLSSEQTIKVYGISISTYVPGTATAVYTATDPVSEPSQSTATADYVGIDPPSGPSSTASATYTAYAPGQVSIATATYAAVASNQVAFHRVNNAWIPATIYHRVGGTWRTIDSPPPPPTTPSAPGGSVTSVTQTSITLGPLTIPSSTGGSPITGYKFFAYNPAGTSAPTFNPEWVSPTPVTTLPPWFTFTNMVADTTYQVGAFAINANGEGTRLRVNGTTATNDQGGSGLPAKVAAMWYNTFQLPRLRNIPIDVAGAGTSIINHVILAIAQSQTAGTGTLRFNPSNGETAAEMKADVLALRAAGANVCIGIGGASDGGITITNPTQVTQAYNSIVSIVTNYGVNGLDIDLEPSGSTWNQTSIVSLVGQLKTTYGPDFIVGITPGLYAPHTTTWLALANALGSNYDYFAPMLYDFPESRDSQLTAVTLDKCNTMVSGGIPQNKIILGFMCRYPSGSTYNASTPQVTLDAYNAAIASYPNIRGAFIWEQYIEGQSSWQWSRLTGKRVRGL